MTDCPMCHRWEKEDDLQIAELSSCYVLLNRDQFFPGYTLVFAKQHQTELFHLDLPRRGIMMEEVNRVAKALNQVFQPTKMNYELLGNMVPHIHWHLVPRFAKDPVWPRPIWSEEHREKHLSTTEYNHRIALIRTALQ